MLTREGLHDRKYRKLFGLDIYLTPVFVISSIIIIAFVTGALVFQEAATEGFKNIREWLTANLDWFFIFSANLVVLFCLYVALSPLGKVRLGGADAKPEYTYLTYLAMLFAAGVGIGLLFFGVAEPVYYFKEPPLGITPRTEEAVCRRDSGDGFSLGATRLGDLWRRWTRPGLFRVQPGVASHDSLGILSLIW